VGSTALPQYPAAASHQRDPCGLEPPLGYRVDAMPELEPLPPSSFSEGQLPNPVNAVPSTPLDVEQRRAGLGLSSEPMAAQGMSQIGAGDVRTERPPYRRY
jgi:hypothetical protein